MNRFKKYDWVLHRRTGHRGSVSEVADNYIEVEWFLYASGRPLLPHLVKSECCLRSELMEYPDEPKIFSYAVLDLALLTKDEDWFNEIQALKGANQ